MKMVSTFINQSHAHPSRLIHRIRTLIDSAIGAYADETVISINALRIRATIIEAFVHAFIDHYKLAFTVNFLNKIKLLISKVYFKNYFKNLNTLKYV